MKKKGLCSTCVHDPGCCFLRKFPVISCEEFSDRTTVAANHIPHKIKKGAIALEGVIVEE